MQPQRTIRYHYMSVSLHELSRDTSFTAIIEVAKTLRSDDDQDIKN